MNIFLIKNKDNIKENEYCWGGIVPYEGKRTKIMFSKNEAIWSFNISLILSSVESIKFAIAFKGM